MGQAACGTSLQGMSVSEKEGYAQVSKASAAEYVAACEAQFGVDRVHKVGLPVHRAKGLECVPFTVDEGAEQVVMDSLESVKRYRMGAVAAGAQRSAKTSGGNSVAAPLTSLMLVASIISIIIY